MNEELVDVEVIRLEPNCPDGTLDYYQEDVRALCKAFSLGLKIITQYEGGEKQMRVYEVYLSTTSFLMEDIRNVIKTFILHNGMTLGYVKTVKMNLDELIDMPQDGISVVENLIVYKPDGLH